MTGDDGRQSASSNRVHRTRRSPPKWGTGTEGGRTCANADRAQSERTRARVNSMVGSLESDSNAFSLRHPRLGSNRSLAWRYSAGAARLFSHAVAIGDVPLHNSRIKAIQSDAAGIDGEGVEIDCWRRAEEQQRGTAARSRCYSCAMRVGLTPSGQPLSTTLQRVRQRNMWLHPSGASLVGMGAVELSENLVL